MISKNTEELTQEAKDAFNNLTKKMIIARNIARTNEHCPPEYQQKLPQGFWNVDYWVK